ncbi:MAG: ribose-5-phosphate isomerase RpiA [Acidobacteriota bacterium]|nr:ribose-5-phosphate isomerase RpiA [Acidobacteriota bacterium]MDH3528156.1 ribose-5-phosphate isomerase RpiA [Acidobacteriota bacterium]
MNNAENEKRLAALEAVKHVEDGMTVGLGTGSTAYFAIEAVGGMVADGLSIKAVPTSAATEEQARGLNIPLVTIDDVDEIDLTIDGTDEWDDDLNLIKGGGGALLKEKMVARFTTKQIIIADSSKRVEKLGAFRIPVEVLPFAVNFAAKRIADMGGSGEIRMREGIYFQTDEKNLIIDADFGLIRDPYLIEHDLNQIEGVVCNGLFLDLADMVIVGRGDGVEVFESS